MKTITKQPENVIQDTKGHIIETARDLFSEYSYLGVLMDDIARKLKITKAALYYHFTGKAEVYNQVLDDVFNNLNFTISQAIDETTLDRKLHKLITNYLDFGRKEKNLIKALVVKVSPNDSKITKHIIKLRKQTVDLIQPVVEEISASKKLTQKVDCQLLTSMLTSLMDGLILEYSFVNYPTAEQWGFGPCLVKTVRPASAL